MTSSSLTVSAPPESSPATTRNPVPSSSDAAPARRQLTATRQSDVLAMIGAALASVCLTWVVFARLVPWSGAVGAALVAFVLFVILYAILSSFAEDPPTVRARVASVLVHSSALILFTALACIIAFTLVRGVSALRHPNFYVQDMVRAGPLSPLTEGGVLHAIIGTLEQIAIALVITVPLGLLTAVFLATTRGSFTRFTRTVVEAMTALPSIVAGLFIYATVIIILGQGKSGAAASLALSVMMLPIIIRSADVVLRLVPGTLVEASYALGASKWRTVWTVVLPTAKSGLATAVILGTARGIGETSPVLLTAGFTKYRNSNAFSGPQVSLPLATFDFIKSPQPTEVVRGFGTAALLLVLVLVLFLVARVIGGRGPGHTSRRQDRRAARASRRDVARMGSDNGPDNLLDTVNPRSSS